MKKPVGLSIVYIGHERKLGGASLCLVTMAKEMKALGHKVCVVLPFRNCPVAKALREEGIKVYSVFFGWWMEPIYWSKGMKFCFSMLYRMKWLAVKRISRIIRKEKADIVHSNSSVIDIGCRAAMKCDCPHVWHFREFGDLDYRLEFIKGRWDSLHFVAESGSSNIFISKALQDYYSELKSDSEHNRVIYDGVSEEYLNYYETKRESDRLIFLIAGNFQRNKRQDVVVKAVKLLKDRGITDYKVIMAGGIADTKDSRQYHNELVEYINREGLECIEMGGYISDMNALRRQVHVEVVPSIMEAFGRVTVEAMLSGNPVLASDTGANRELIEDNKTGWFFREGDAEALAEKMEYIIKNPEMVSPMGNAAYQEAKKKYLSDRNTKDVERLYYAILNKKFRAAVTAKRDVNRLSNENNQYISVIALLVSIFAIIVSFREGELARNSTYLPKIKVETLDSEEKIQLTWNNDPMSDSQDIPQMHLKLTNIGNGNANNVAIIFDNKVLGKWQKKLKEMNPDIGSDYMVDEENFLIEVPYILMGKENAVTVMFPNAYLECLSQLYKWKEITDEDAFELPNIRMTVVYEDIQGKVISYDIECISELEENVYIGSSEGNSIIIGWELNELDN